MARRSLLLLALAVVACTSRTEPAAPVTAKLDLYPGPHDFALMLGAVMKVPIGLFDAAGEPLEMPGGLTLVSRSPAIISVDSGTWIRARAMGGAWLVATVPYHGTILTDSNNVGVVCTAELIVGITPTNVTLAVGESSVAPVVTLKGCGGQLTFTDTFEFTAIDPTIVSVNLTTGRATGLSVGTTGIAVRGAFHGMIGIIAVTVR
jgi:hypothetical protein